MIYLSRDPARIYQISFSKKCERNLPNKEDGFRRYKKMKEKRNMPRVETRIVKLPGKSLIKHQTIITDIKPIAYYNAVIENSP